MTSRTATLAWAESIRPEVWPTMRSLGRIVVATLLILVLLPALLGAAGAGIPIAV